MYVIKKRHILVNVHRTTDEYVIQHHIFYAGVWRPEANSNNWLENHFYMVILCKVLYPLSPSRSHTQTQTQTAQIHKWRGKGEGERDDPMICPSKRKEKISFTPCCSCATLHFDLMTEVICTVHYQILLTFLAAFNIPKSKTFILKLFMQLTFTKLCYQDFPQVSVLGIWQCDGQSKSKRS